MFLLDLRVLLVAVRNQLLHAKHRSAIFGSQLQDRTPEVGTRTGTNLQVQHIYTMHPAMAHLWTSTATNFGSSQESHSNPRTRETMVFFCAKTLHEVRGQSLKGPNPPSERESLYSTWPCALTNDMSEYPPISDAPYSFPHFATLLSDSYHKARSTGTNVVPN